MEEAGRSREVGDQGVWSAVDPSPQQTALASDTKILVMPSQLGQTGEDLEMLVDCWSSRPAIQVIQRRQALPLQISLVRPDLFAAQVTS